MKKARVPIAKDTSANVLYLSDRTCCVCNERGKSVQIHHIDEDPSNNNEENLAVLCFNCHELTQIKGGFGRKLDAQQTMKYKTEWLERVKNRREQADKLASLNTIETTIHLHLEDCISVQDEGLIEYEINYPEEKKRLEKYLLKIVDLKATLFKHALPEIERGVTSEVVMACNELIDFFEEVLNELSKFYPYDHFSNDPKKFFNKQIGLRANWHWEITQTFGRGKSGTIVSVLVSSQMVEEADSMVKEMVTGLSTLKYELNFVQWLEKWKAIKL